MATTTFSGPIKAGTIQNTTGTTIGTNIANVGQVVMSQTFAVSLAAGAVAAAVQNVVIPANSQIVDCVIDQITAANTTTNYSVGDVAGGDPFTFNEFTGIGNNSDTTFALGFTPNSNDLTCIVTLDGIVQPDSAYNISGSNITFVATPEQDVNIRVLSMASEASLVQVGDGTVFANAFAQSANTHIEEIGIRMSIAMG